MLKSQGLPEKVLLSLIEAQGPSVVETRGYVWEDDF